jgi:hypothetical protein
MLLCGLVRDAPHRLGFTLHYRREPPREVEHISLDVVEGRRTVPHSIPGDSVTKLGQPFSRSQL